MLMMALALAVAVPDCAPRNNRGSEAPHLKPRSIMTGGQPPLQTSWGRGPLPYLSTLSGHSRPIADSAGGSRVYACC
jgi:hypothetical protein